VRKHMRVVGWSLRERWRKRARYYTFHGYYDWRNSWEYLSAHGQWYDCT
jgi:hypothetical protein